MLKYKKYKDVYDPTIEKDLVDTEIARLSNILSKKLNLYIHHSFDAPGPGFYYPPGTENPKEVGKPKDVPVLYGWPIAEKEVHLHEAGHHVIHDVFPYNILGKLGKDRAPISFLTAAISVPAGAYALSKKKYALGSGLLALPVATYIAGGAAKVIEEGMASIVGERIGKILKLKQNPDIYRKGYVTYLNAVVPGLKPHDEE